MPMNYPNFLKIVPSDKSRKLAHFDEVKNNFFQVVNRQHTVAACLKYVNDLSSTEEVKELFSK